MKGRQLVRNWPMNRVLILLVLSFTIFWAIPLQVARAATFTVNSTADAVDANPGDSLCATGAGECTLRAAIMEANALPGADTITLPAGTYFLTIPGAGEDAAATGDLDIASDLTITGAGQATTIIDGNSLDRVIDVLSGTTVAISGLTVQNGNIDSQDNGILFSRGGGIFNHGTLTVTDSTISGNTASAVTASFGGGIYSRGTLTVTDSTISGNTADVGGGIMNERTLTITNSTISGNTTAFEGGGIRNGFIDATAEITNSTISGNTARNGGGIMNVGTLMLTNSTISGNTAVTSLGGGGIYVFLGVVEPVNTIIAGNSAPFRPDCFGNPASLGNNLIGNNSGCSFIPATGDLVNVDPKLGPLADNGGPTQTHALLPTSPAIDHIPVVNCTDPDGNPITTDQRGVPRPQGAACDIGAFEFGLAATEVAIDIKPGSDPNAIRPTNRGLIPVAILTTDGFDATTVSPITVGFGPAGAGIAHRLGHLEDVDSDGDLDLVLHFRTRETGIQCGDTSASLTGETFDGQAIQGSDSIVTVGCH